MKKLSFVVMAIFSMFLFLGNSKAAESTINVYVFKSSTCPHCAEAIEFLEDLEIDNEYQNYFHLIPLETYGSATEIQENVKLAQKVAKYFGITFEGVPLIVIGDKYHEGFSSSMEEELKSEILSAYQNENYEDIVAGIQNGTLKSSNFDAIMSVMIVIVLVGGIAYFIYAARKNVVVEDAEDVVQEEISESVEEKTPKKTTKKATQNTKKTKKNQSK